MYCSLIKVIVSNITELPLSSLILTNCDIVLHFFYFSIIISFADVYLVIFVLILPEEEIMMILKTLALVILFFVDLSCIKDESCIPCVAVFCEDY